MSKYSVTITKTCVIEVVADNATAAEASARDKEADGCLGFDMVVDTRPILIGMHTIDHWIRVLDDECGVAVYESGDLPGQFGFTGCDADHFESLAEAVEAAVMHYDLVDAVTA